MIDTCDLGIPHGKFTFSCDVVFMSLLCGLFLFSRTVLLHLYGRKNFGTSEQEFENVGKDPIISFSVLLLTRSLCSRSEGWVYLC
jgi:hypothetical protein